MEIRSTLVLSILFSTLNFRHTFVIQKDDVIYELSNATWTNSSPKPPERFQTILFTYVEVPDSSSKLFSQLLEEVKYFNSYRCAMSRLYLPIGLLDLGITDPLKPIDIVISPNGSYSLKQISMAAFHKLPTQIAHLQSLEFVYFARTPVLELDFELFAKMENLTTFSMRRTTTKDIYFSERHQYPLLRMFTVSANYLTTFKATSWHFPSLEVLDLHFNKFIELPEEIATFENLTCLCLQNNQIKTINNHIFKGMRRLEILYLQQNHISSITGKLQLPSLSELCLSINRLEELDVSRWHLPALRTIDLRRNLLKSVVGFAECFGGTDIIDLEEGPWDCSWLEEIGRSIRGMTIWNKHYNSSLHCYGHRYNNTNISVVETLVNGTIQKKAL